MAVELEPANMTDDIASFSRYPHPARQLPAEPSSDEVEVFGREETSLDEASHNASVMLERQRWAKVGNMAVPNGQYESHDGGYFCSSPSELIVCSFECLI